MQIAVDRRSEVPVYRQIADQLRAAIAGRALAPGRRLPSVRELASDLSVNLNTVARAYRMLQEEGFLAIQDRSGVRVLERGAVSGGSARKRLWTSVREALQRLHQSGLSHQDIERRVAREVAALSRREA